MTVEYNVVKLGVSKYLTVCACVRACVRACVCVCVTVVSDCAAFALTLLCICNCA